ncbi:MAG: hypothetical protein WBF75_03750 [Pseudonocardiaceae bacterium]
MGEHPGLGAVGIALHRDDDTLMGDFCLQSSHGVADEVIKGRLLE